MTLSKHYIFLETLHRNRLVGKADVAAEDRNVVRDFIRVAPYLKADVTEDSYPKASYTRVQDNNIQIEGFTKTIHKGGSESVFFRESGMKDGDVG